MSILRFENRTPRNLEKMYKYLTDPNKTDSYGLIGVGINPFNAVNEMRFIQRMHNRRNLSHEYIQIIFSFDVGIAKGIGELKEICAEIGRILITDQRQVFGAMHYLNTDKIHCHYIINYVGLNGSLYEQKYSVYYYRNLVNKILKKHDLKPIKGVYCSGDGKENEVNGNM